MNRATLSVEVLEDRTALSNSGLNPFAYLPPQFPSFLPAVQTGFAVEAGTVAHATSIAYQVRVSSDRLIESVRHGKDKLIESVRHDKNQLVESARHDKDQLIDPYVTRRTN